MPLRAIFKTRTIPLLIIVATIAIVVSLFAAPAFSVSSNQCSSCHGSAYNMQLDITEGSSQNVIPQSILVGQTQTVTVTIQNINNAPSDNLFTSVAVTLSSQNHHFSVANPTYNVGTLATGSATATWHITGTSEGQDAIIISATATNPHENRYYSDNYSPNPSITVLFNPNLTPTPTPSPTPISTSTTSPSSTLQPTASPQSTTNPTTTKTQTPTQSPTSKPTQPSTSTSIQTPTSNPSPTTTPTIQPHSELLNSQMLYIHPPIAITGYILIFVFAVFMLKENYLERKITKITGVALWLFTFLGLLTGMVWAQLAWGSYWSWDPKETMTLALFLSASAGQLFYFEKKYTMAKWLALLTCVLVILTGLTSFILSGMHSFA